MPVSPWIVTLITFIPAGVSVLGGILASFYVPKPKLIAFLQHFVAGVVIAAVAVELLPKILGHGAPLTIGIGFVAGAVLMLLLHELAHFLAKGGKERPVPVGLVTAAAIDLFIDGVLIGVAFLAGQASGVFIAISLSLCAFFLNLSVSATMSQRKAPRGSQFFSTILIAVMLPLGALIGSSIVSHLPPSILIETLAFGVAALLYLGVEELLVESHATQDSAWICSAFFLGFLLILLFKF